MHYTFITYITYTTYKETKKQTNKQTKQNKTKQTNKQIKGLDNPAYQLLPISSQRKVKTGWWRIGVCKKCVSKGRA